MFREYTREQYLERIAWMKNTRNRRSASPRTSSSASPAKPKREFQETLALLDEVQYDGVFSFKYSPRPNTPALEVHRHRSGRREIAPLAGFDGASAGDSKRINYRKHVGQIIEVMVEAENAARSTMDWPHFAEQDAELSRCLRACSRRLVRIYQVRVTQAFPNSLAGELVAPVDRREKGITMEVEMKIRGLMMDPVTNMPIVILKDIGSDTVLPIWVGVYEANAIALEIEKVATPRPMTHDLLKNVLLGMEAQVEKVVVTELKDDTFYAVIWVTRNGSPVSIDSRPSDALALALRVDCPIYVEDEVLKTSKQATQLSDRVTSDDLRKWLEGLGDDDLGRYKM